ncbi:Methyltransferase-like protein 21D [Podila epigama]|nr:Methyltransferase-like protein 21D [Podila epigama]
MNESVLTSREFEFNDHSVEPLEIYEDPTGTLRGGVGSTIWDAAIVLSKYIEKSKLFASPTQDQRPFTVLELGSGTGIVGLAIARLMASKNIQGKVVLTDKESVVPLLQKNADSNVSKGVNVLAQVVDWEVVSGIKTTSEGDDGTESSGQLLTNLTPFVNLEWDLVILSDCIWVPSLYPPLIGTLEKLITLPKTQLLIAFEKRNFSEEMNFFASLGKSFKFRDIKPEEQDDVWQSEDIYLFSCHRRVES